MITSNCKTEIKSKKTGGRDLKHTKKGSAHFTGSWSPSEGDGFFVLKTGILIFKMEIEVFCSRLLKTETILVI